MIAATVLFFHLLRAKVSFRSCHVPFGPVSLFVANMMVPGIYVGYVAATWQWHTLAESWINHSLLGTPLIPLFVADALCILLLAIRTCKRRLSKWIAGGIILIHWGLWAPCLPEGPFDCLRWSMWDFWNQWVFVSLSLIAAFVFSVLIINSGAEQSRVGADQPRRAVVAKVALAVSIAVLAFIWMPTRAAKLSDAGNLDQAVIEVNRGPCFGRCPSYNITIHGNGFVEFVNYDGRSASPRREARISAGQFRDIVRLLDQAQFSSLEDRAFLWSSDSPTVGVNVALGRKKKNVVSSGGMFEDQTPTQASFLRAVDSIDQIVGTDKLLASDNSGMGHPRE
jgi:hypothetical protein